jgi:hypothetical protein
MHKLLSEKEENALRCLGAAVLLLWDDLPTNIQRELFQSATSDVETNKIAQLKEQIARFLHTHKGDEQSAPTRPPSSHQDVAP